MKEMKLEIQFRNEPERNFTIFLKKKHWWSRWKPEHNLWRQHRDPESGYYLDEWATITRL